MTESFGARLRAAMDRFGPLCVGIDPHAALLDQWGLAQDADGLRSFGLAVVDAAAGRAAVVKPQVAFFERFGSRGYAALEDIMAAARDAGSVQLETHGDPRRLADGEEVGGDLPPHVATSPRRAHGEQRDEREHDEQHADVEQRAGGEDVRGSAQHHPEQQARCSSSGQRTGAHDALRRAPRTARARARRSDAEPPRPAGHRPGAHRAPPAGDARRPG